MIVVAVIASADRAISAWEERAPRFAAASTAVSGALKMLGYRAVAERGLLMLDHPDGVVTIVPSMEKLAVRPLLLFGIARVLLWLVRDARRMAAAAVVGLGAMIIVGLVRYAVLLAVYAEHDDILVGTPGVIALDQFASPWITDSTVWSSFAVFSLDREKLAMDLVRLLDREPCLDEIPVRGLATVAAVTALIIGLRMAGTGLAWPAVLLGVAGSWAGMAASEGVHRRVYAWPEPHAPIDEVTFLWQGGACAFPPVLGTPDSVPLDRSYDTMLVAVQRLGLVPRVAYTYGEDLLSPATRAMFVIAPVNTPPPGTMARLREFVRAGGSRVVMDDSRVGERGSAKALLGLFDVSIVYHGPQQSEGGQKPHVHINGMERVPVPAGDAFAARKASGRGQVVYIWDAADFSRQGLGHCFARPWKSARARYETIFALLGNVLRIAPGDRRFYGVL